MSEARAFHTATLLRNGKVLIVGGYNNTTGALSSVEIFSPTAEFSFSSAQKYWSTSPLQLNTARASHTSTLLVNDNVLVIGNYLQVGGTAIPSTEILFTLP